MPLGQFNVVIVGEGFPVGSIRSDEFNYMDSPFVDTTRLGPLVQASSGPAALQILPNRFQASIEEPDATELSSQIAELSQIAATFLEFVGRRSVIGVGHNVQWTVELASGPSKLPERLLNLGFVSSLLDGESAESADVSLFFKGPDGVPARLLVAASADPFLLDFNFNHAQPEGGGVQEALGKLPESVDTSISMATRFELLLGEDQK